MRKLVSKVVFPLLALAALPLCGAVDDSDWQKGPNDRWFVNWDKALAAAKKAGKPMFVLKTGSDWCYWCKKLHSEVLDTPEFEEYAKANLVLVYLDSPNRNPLGKEQNRHNRRVSKALSFGGGVPCAALVSTRGNKLGLIGGGGLAADAYLEKIKSYVGGEGTPLADADAQVLFAEGYAALAAKIDARLAALPPATKDDFKATVTGIAVGGGVGVSGANGLSFADLKGKMDVPFRKPLIFRIEYDLPEGYGARMFVQPIWPSSERKNYRYFQGNNSGPLCKGKGTVYSYTLLNENESVSRLKSVVVRVLPDPEFDDYPYGWSGRPETVDIGFMNADGDSAPEPEKKVIAAPADDRKWRKGPDRLWFVNWVKAVAEAKKTGRKLFVLNTGSDWCGWCKKLRADVLESGKFKAYARKNLVLVYLDSPRQNPLPADQQAHTQAVRGKLQFGGGVPCAKIVDSDGENVLETIGGYRPEKEYLKALKDAVGK